MNEWMDGRMNERMDIAGAFVGRLNESGQRDATVHWPLRLSSLNPSANFTLSNEDDSRTGTQRRESNEIKGQLDSVMTSQSDVDCRLPLVWCILILKSLKSHVTHVNKPIG